MNTDIHQGFRLGEWRVNPDQGLLEGEDRSTRLEPKVMGVLLYLVEHQGEVVKRDDLIRDVWEGTFVTDEALSRAISVLRTQLGDDRMTPTYIQTLPKVGYRLIMPVEPLEPEPGSEPDQDGAKGPHPKWYVLGAVTIVLIAALASWFLVNEDDEPDSPADFADISEWFDFLTEEKEGTDGVTSIAVLPFNDLTEQQQNRFFSDGLTDELTVSLSKVKGLKVVARRSSYSFQNRSDDVPTVGRLLNVDAVFEGTIRQNGDKLRINALLSDVSDGYLIWSEVLECTAEDIFETQEEMAAAVVEAMRGHFSDGSLQLPLVKQAPPDMEAYQLYLMNGNFLWQLRGEQPLRQSIELYRQALAIDPSFSRALIGLANSLVLLPFYSSEPIEPKFEEAHRILSEHTFTDSRDQGEVEAIYAFMAMHRWQWVEAEERFRRALELASESPNIYQWYSQHLSNVGRRHDGLKAAQRARELDEISPVINDRLGVAYLWMDDNVRAAEHFAIGAQLGFRNAINPGYMLLLLRLQRFNEFKAVVSAFHRDSQHSPDWIIDHAESLFAEENRETAQALARQAVNEGRTPLPRFEFGMWIMLGAIDEAYRTFAAYQDTTRQNLQLELVFTEEAREFREDPRFSALAEDIGWKDYWKKFGGPDGN